MRLPDAILTDQQVFERHLLEGIMTAVILGLDVPNGLGMQVNLRHRAAPDGLGWKRSGGWNGAIVRLNNFRGEVVLSLREDKLIVFHEVAKRTVPAQVAGILVPGYIEATHDLADPNLIEQLQWIVAAHLIACAVADIEDSELRTERLRNQLRRSRIKTAQLGQDLDQLHKVQTERPGTTRPIGPESQGAV